MTLSFRRHWHRHESPKALADVWLQRDVPADVRKAINLPQLDEGIDLIARERHGGYWAIQAKFVTATDKRLSRRLLGTFTALALTPAVTSVCR